jgi:hypothetical protein
MLQVVGGYLAICGVLASTPDGMKQMLQLSGMKSLLQSTMLHSNPNTLLSACSITMKVLFAITSLYFLSALNLILGGPAS